MIKYYVVEITDLDFDLDATPWFKTRSEAEWAKYRYEEQNPEIVYTIWEVD